MNLSPEEKKARSRRNIVLGLALAAFVALVFAVTVAKLSINLA